MAKPELICTTCGFIGRPKDITKGSFIIELFLWLVLLLPGVIYSLWRMTSRYKACPSCKGSNMIPLDTPMARKLLAEYHRS